jgi:hypothetical protein
MNYDAADTGGNFYLVESRVCPETVDGFKTLLGDDETFETEFIGATVQECQSWARHYQYQRLFIERGIFAIADARSAAEHTISMRFFAVEYPSHLPPLEFGEYGVLPRVRDTWYEFRIAYKDTGDVWSSLNFVSPNIVYPVYFGRKEEVTDECGVFNAVRAGRLIEGKD